MDHRQHTRSRLGCKQCKLHRIKCDESRPSCTRCSKSRRQCSYLAEIPTLPASPSSLSTASPSVASLPNIALAKTPSSNTGGGSIDGRGAGFYPLPTAAAATTDPSYGVNPESLGLEERYGLFHLHLLHYFEHELAQSVADVHPGLAATLPMLAAEAFKATYLMDEILALSAAHKSTHQVLEMRSLYITEATRLQTRALETLNHSKPQISAYNCMPMFIFSSLVAQHAIFNVSNTPHDDLGALLEGLINCICLSRGIGIIRDSAWPLLQARLWGEAAEACTSANSNLGNIEKPHEVLDLLLQRIGDSSLNASMIFASSEAARSLRQSFSTLNPSDSPNSHWMAAVQEWMIGVPPDYVECLRQRRQEALVVLAHYAVMLHYTSRYWFVGDLGARLINLITCHLGSYWEGWLQWPNRVIRERAM